MPNSAQLEGTPYHSPKLHPCSSMAYVYASHFILGDKNTYSQPRRGRALHQRSLLDKVSLHTFGGFVPWMKRSRPCRVRRRCWRLAVSVAVRLAASFNDR